jgi:hypothetical protein
VAEDLLTLELVPTKTRLRKIGLLSQSLLLLTVLAGCSGKDGTPGPQGSPGSTGEQGTPGPEGPQGAQGPTGMNGTSPDGGTSTGLPTSCLSPCHGFDGVVEQWKTSTHYSTFIANLGGEEVATWTGARSCGNCHAMDGIEQRVANNVGTVDGAAVPNLGNGHLEYANPQNNKLSEPNYAGVSKVAAVSCLTCHSVTNETDPHRTGMPYTKGSFPLRVPSGEMDSAFIEKSPDTSAITGMTAGNRGPSNTCIWCHKSRKDVTNFIVASNTITSAYWGPHEGPQADIYSGKGGYHYTGLAYGTSTHEQKLACIDCHMPSVASNSGAPDHSFNAKIGACTSCHVGATNFDVNGGQGQVTLAMQELRAALNNAGMLTRGSSSPYPALSASELKDSDFALDKARPGGGMNGGPTVLDADQAGALYNYLILARGSALGVHNPKYTRQLIFDSYFAVTGLPPTSLSRPQ